MDRKLLIKCLEFSCDIADQIEGSMKQTGPDTLRIELTGFDEKFTAVFNLENEPWGILALHDVGQWTAKTATAECFVFEYAHSVHHIINMPKDIVADIVKKLRKDGVVTIDPASLN